MADSMRVVIENEAEVKAAIERLGLDVAALLKEAVQAAAEVVQEAAAWDAPGPHIEIEVVAESKDRVEMEVGPDEAHWYYKFAETGRGAFRVRPKTKLALYAGGGRPFAHANVGPMAARPFLRPAVDENEATVQDAAGEVWKRVLG